MTREEIIMLGFRTSKDHMHGMDKYGHEHFRLDVPGTRGYFYIGTEPGRVSTIQVVSISGGNDCRKVEDIQSIVQYIIEKSITVGKIILKNDVKGLLS